MCGFEERSEKLRPLRQRVQRERALLLDEQRPRVHRKQCANELPSAVIPRCQRLG
jgi:hypothetical protein